MLPETPIVFIVDDDPAVCRALTRLVRAAGYAAQAFTSGQEFLDGFDRDAPGCIVLDVTMPDLTGLELQEVLTASKSILPVIFLTGYADVGKAVRALKGGAVDFLSKPVQASELLAAIQRAIRSNRVARAGLSQRAHDIECLQLLTAREYEVFAHVVTGKPNKIIAADLGTCEQTIKVHRGRVMKNCEPTRLRSWCGWPIGQGSGARKP